MSDDYWDEAENRTTDNPQAEKIKKRHYKHSQVRKTNALKKMLSFQENREFFFGLLSECEIFGNVGDESANAAFRFLGRRDIGQLLLADIFRADDNAYRMMQVEAQKRTDTLEREIENAGRSGQED